MIDVTLVYEDCKLLREGNTIDFKADVTLEASARTFNTRVLVCRIRQYAKDAIVLREGDVFLSDAGWKGICLVITKVLEEDLVFGTEVWYNEQEPSVTVYLESDCHEQQLKECERLIEEALKKNPFTDMDVATSARFESDWNALFRIYKFEGYKSMCKQAGDKLVELLLKDLGLQK